MLSTFTKGKLPFTIEELLINVDGCVDVPGSYSRSLKGEPFHILIINRRAPFPSPDPAACCDTDKHPFCYFIMTTVQEQHRVVLENISLTAEF